MRSANCADLPVYSSCCKALAVSTAFTHLDVSHLQSISCAVSSVVEHFLDTEGVRGSNPLSRTIDCLESSRARQPAAGSAAKLQCLYQETITGMPALCLC